MRVDAGVGGRGVLVAAQGEHDLVRVEPSRYSLPKGATTLLVDAARQRDKRIGNLGEWHSHPHGRGSSSDDRAMMRALVWFLPFPRPILLIVAREKSGNVLSGYASRVLFLLRAEIVTTGPLPPR